LLSSFQCLSYSLAQFKPGTPGRTTDFYFHESNGEYIEVGWYEGADWQPTMKWLFAAIEGPGIPGFYEKVTSAKG
jgi:hypothetical protein